MAQLYTILGVVAVLLVLSVFASKAAVKLGVPTLLLFMALGIVAGSEGVGGLWFDYPRIAQGVGVVALVYILYAAGFDTHAAELQQQNVARPEPGDNRSVRKLSFDGSIQPLCLWPEVELRSAPWCRCFVY